MAQPFPNELKHLYNEAEFIGSGGFARVFKAKHRDGRIVAVKIPINLDEAIGKSFLREITSWQRLNHSNIVSLFDANILPIPYLEQEYMDGGNLESLIKPLEVDKACEIIFNIAEGLKYAHKQGIVHLDLKPQNILLTKDDLPKITDWGMSRVIAKGKSLTQHGYTPEYASPEQISPKKFGKTDERTDIYQLGVIFYNLLTNELPFKGEDLLEIAFAIVNDEPVAPSELNPDAKEVEHIALRCLMKNKEERYQSAEELQRELERFIRLKEKPEDLGERRQQKTVRRGKPKEEQERIPRKREENREELKVPKKEGKTSYKKIALVIIALLLLASVLGALVLGYWAPAPAINNKPENITSKSIPALTLPFPGPVQGQKAYTNSIGMEFALIPAGEFDMGSPSNETGRYIDESPVHHVKIAYAFYLGKYEVTQKQWREVMGYNPSFSKGDNLPVENVSWIDAQEFIKKLNEKERTNKYRLPHEAEYEYAARAGTTTKYFFGDDETMLDEYAWYEGNSGAQTHEVGQKKPNPWGLYDIYGNVFQWMQDVYHNSYDGAPTDGRAWETAGSIRVFRGGSFFSVGSQLRSAQRRYFDPNAHFALFGLRLVRDV